MTEDKRNQPEEPGDDSEVEAFLRGESPVSAVYRATAAPEPSAALDRAILAEARAAARVSGGGQMARWMRWLKPLSAVAVMGLCISVVLQMLQPPVEQAVFLEMDDSDALNRAPAAAEAVPVEAPAAQASAPLIIEEITVTARKERESLQEVPLSISALGQADIQADYDELEKKADASTAPMAGSVVTQAVAEPQFPAIDTWEAGIRYLRAAGATDRADLEREKLRGRYPDYGPPARFALDLAGLDAATEPMDGTEPRARQSAKDKSDLLYPAPDVWLAGIRYLREQGALERAEMELQSLREVYPGHPE